MKIGLGTIAVLSILQVGCTARDSGPAEQLPYALTTAGNGVVHIGRRVDDATPGEVKEFANLDLRDGVTRAWVEVDSDGVAASFELWYDPEVQYHELVGYYRSVLGPNTNQYARLVGECVVWEDVVVRFEVCRSREAGEHGYIIAHAWPVRPIDA